MVTQETLEGHIKAYWQCSHSGMVEPQGWCGRCGCVRDDYVLQIKRGDQLILGAGGYAFFHQSKYIWFRDALYELGLLPRPSVKEAWQSVEKAQGVTEYLRCPPRPHWWRRVLG